MARTVARPSRTEKLQRLFELAAGQGGHFTSAQARELGYGARSLVHHVDARHVERVSRGEATGRAVTTGLVSPKELRAAVRRRSARVRQLVARALQEVGLRACVRHACCLSCRH